MRPYDLHEGSDLQGAEAPVADMASLNAPGPEDAIVAEAELVRERGGRLDAYTGALDAHTEAMRGLAGSVDALADRCSSRFDATEAAVGAVSRDVAEMRAELGSLCGDATDRALEVGEHIARRHFSWMSGAIRDQDSAMAEAARGASAAIVDAADRAVARVNAASAAATSAIDKSKIDVPKVMGEMRRQYLAKLLVVPIAVAVMVLYLTVLTWRVWPVVSGSTMTDLDVANLRIEQLSAELEAYRSTGVTLGDEQQGELDERLVELQEAYDAAHGGDSAGGAEG